MQILPPLHALLLVMHIGFIVQSKRMTSELDNPNCSLAVVEDELNKTSPFDPADLSTAGKFCTYVGTAPGAIVDIGATSELYTSINIYWTMLKVRGRAE